MRLDDLTNKLKSALMDSAELISRDEEQIISMALADLSRYKPQKRVATFKLVSGQLVYPAPNGLMHISNVMYGQSQRSQLKPWQEGYPKKLPTFYAIEGDEGMFIQLSHFPAEGTLLSCGREVTYTYWASRAIKDGDIHLPVELEPLLLLRCVAEAVKHIMVHQLNKTVSVRNSIGGEAKNGTPAAVHEQLMRQFERQIADA
ncbi:phage adaptor protein [Vibrio sp. ER1A]|uniref:phage adaptor protein n=1 Tax=Vibrio sp. ER1A TaxID=1517681 RepID=UPI0004DD734C|nr:hypothetical protein [Vibrio sp. ER1A]KFA98784.1 hypothetical protein HW45_07115 [Vibrio sp. ER1A]